MEKENKIRPAKISVAVTLLYIVVVISILNSLLLIKARVDSLISAKQGVFYLHKSLWQASLSSMDPTGIKRFIWSIPIFLLLLITISGIRKGKNWARILFLIWYSTSILKYVFVILFVGWGSYTPFSGTFPIYDTIFRISTFVRSIIQLLALVFVFQKESSVYFSTSSEKREKE